MVEVVSLVAAVRDKYCPVLDEESSEWSRIHQSACYLAPGRGLPVERRTSLILDGCCVGHAGEGRELSQLCPRVEEAYLCGNMLSHWDDITTILRSLPNLVFLDLTKNPLSSHEFVRVDGVVSTHLATLALNHTKIEWTAVETCLTLAPNLVELHLGLNGYSTVNLSDDFSHGALKRLYVQGNAFNDWTELAKLSKAFTQLSTLIASDNPLTKVTSTDNGCFPELAILGLNNTQLEDWQSFEHLSQLRDLKELNVLRVPIVETVDDRTRRFSIIARIPSLCKLNKSSVGSTEREDAERWMLREYQYQENPPALYTHYRDKHGVLDQLADVDLSPRKTVKLEFHFKDGRDPVTLRVKIDQTIGEFKRWVAAELVGVPSADVRLLYVDSMGWEGVQVLKLSGRKLYCYREMRDGDQIHVQVLPPRK